MLERVADAWDRGVLQPRDRALDRLWERWDGVASGPLSRAADRIAIARDCGLSVRLTSVVVLVALGAGCALALATGRLDATGDTSAARAQPGPRADTISAVVHVLAAERSAARRRLSASRTPDGQAAAAETVAGAYRAGASVLAAARAVPDGATLRAMRVATTAYDALARAARRRDRRGYSAARRRVAAAERALRRALR